MHDAKSRAEEWIRAGGEHPYPEDLVEETRRRDLLEEPLRHLDRMVDLVERIATESRQLTDHDAAPATQTEIGQAARHFDQVATGNLSLLRDLGFDRWDSMDDVHTFLDYGQELARVRFGLSFPPDVSSGRVALAERPFGREATVLVDELYQWLPTHAATDHAGRYRAIRADLALGPGSQVLRSYRRLKATNDGRFPSVASLMSRSG